MISLNITESMGAISDRFKGFLKPHSWWLNKQNQVMIFMMIFRFLDLSTLHLGGSAKWKFHVDFF